MKEAEGDGKEKGGSNPEPASENVNECLTLDEKCCQLMDHIVKKRIKTPAYIEYVNRKIIQFEKKIVEERAKQTLASVTPPKTVETFFDERLAKSLLDSNSDNHAMYSKLNDRLDKLSKVTRQIRNDEIHKLQRAPFDTRTILTRAKKCTPET